MLRSAHEMLYDSEAALRLVERALAEIRGTKPREPAAGAPDSSRLAPTGGEEINQLQHALSRASLEMTERFLQVSGMLAELERRIGRTAGSVEGD
jgi:hypothetical protein